MSYSSFLCSYGRGSGPIKNDDFSGGSGMGTVKVSRKHPDGHQRRMGNWDKVFIYGGGIIAIGYRAKTKLH